jgi:hypothetical protein
MPVWTPTGPVLRSELSVFGVRRRDFFVAAEP